MIKTGLNRYVYDFPVNYKVINTSNIINTPRYLIKKWYKTMVGFIKK